MPAPVSMAFIPRTHAFGRDHRDAAHNAAFAKMLLHFDTTPLDAPRWGRRKPSLTMRSAWKMAACATLRN